MEQTPFHPFFVSQIFQRRKSDANKQDFENKLNLTCHVQSTPKTTGILTNLFSTSGRNLVTLAWTADELSRGQTQNGALKLNLTLKVKFNHPKNNRDLNQGLLHLCTKFGDPSLNRWWVIARTNLVTDGRTDAGNDNTRRPILASGKNQRWIQTGVTVRKLSIRVKIGDFFVSGDLEIWWMTLKNNTAPVLYYVKPCVSFQTHGWIALCIISKPWVNSNWSYSPESLISGQNRHFFCCCCCMWPWNLMDDLEKQ